MEPLTVKEAERRVVTLLRRYMSDEVQSQSRLMAKVYSEMFTAMQDLDLAEWYEKERSAR